MKISIIIPVFNGENWIYRCLKSCLQQKFSEFEILVINDGSTDNTSKIVQEFNSIKISLFEIENGGASRARYFGINKCKGKYVLFLDCDDTLNDNSLNVLYSHAIKYNCDLVVGQANIIKSLNIIQNTNYKIADYVNVQEAFLYGNLPVTLWGILYKKHILNDNYKPSNIKIGEDYLITSQLFSLNYKVSVIDAVIYNYYLHNESITASLNYEKFYDNFMAFRTGVTIIKNNIKKDTSLNSLQYHYLNYFFGLLINSSPFINDFRKLYFSEFGDAKFDYTRNFSMYKNIIIHTSIKSKFISKFISCMFKIYRMFR